VITETDPAPVAEVTAADGPVGASAPNRGQTAARMLLDHGVVVAFVIVFATLSLASDWFLTKTNLLNVLEVNADVGIVACAFTLVVVAGGLDLSLGAIFAFAGVIAAELTIEVGLAAGIAAGIASGAVLGAFNGLTVTVGRVNSFIATLATGIVIRSLALVITGGFRAIPDPDSGFTDLGRNALLGVRYSVWLFALTALVTGLVLARGRFGREAAVVGINPVAARLSGVAVQRVRFLTFVISGFAAGVAGVVITSRAGQASADAAMGFELPVIAAVAVGGTSFAGGEGAIWRTVVGVLFIGLINNGLNLLDVDSRYQQLVLGVLVLIAVAADLGRRTGPGRAGAH
jgi:ribose transport system permease protein